MARPLRAGVALIVILLFVTTLAGAVLGLPIGLVFVETGSMSPEIEPGSGYIAVPTAITGPVEPGDVVVFDAVNLNDGGLVTHRVVSETEGGYITKGDANPFTDQDGEEPLVQEAQIRAKALTVGGQVVTLPYLGTVVTSTGGIVKGFQQQLGILLGTRLALGVEGLSYILLVFGTVTYLVAALAGRSHKQSRSRQRRRNTGLLNPPTVIVAMTLILVVILTASMVFPGGLHEFQFVSSQVDSPGPGVIQTGETENSTFEIPSNGVLPVVAIIEPVGDGVSVNQSVLYVPRGETEKITVTLQAPSETGSCTRLIREQRYLGFLPTSVILFLHQYHPWLPLIAINLLVGMLFAGVAALLIGIDPIRIDHKNEYVPLLIRIRRRLK
jgi:signal peptidase